MPCENITYKAPHIQLNIIASPNKDSTWTIAVQKDRPNSRVHTISSTATFDEVTNLIISARTLQPSKIKSIIHDLQKSLQSYRKVRDGVGHRIEDYVPESGNTQD